MGFLEIVKIFLVLLGEPVFKATKLITFKKRIKTHLIFSQKRRWLKKYFPRWIKIAFVLIILMGIIYWFYENIISDLPNINLIYNPPKLSTKILDRNSNLLFKFYESEDRSWVPLEKIPQNLINATLAIEDKEFFKHKGISLRGIVIAIWHNIKHGQSLRGGSTITQQLVKNVFLSNKKVFKRKIQEIILAKIIEIKLSKNEILERYFNQVAYGGETYGVQEAALKYFGKNVWEINTAEAAFLAGLVASPTTYNFVELAKERQKVVINQMVAANFLSKEDGEKLKNSELSISKNHVNIKAAHFVFYVKDLVTEKFNLDNIPRSGFVIKTSLDLKIQEMAEEIVRKEISQAKKLHITNGAAVVLDVKTGDILAMVGSVNGDYNVVTALRQPGSAIKPINYLLALKRGYSINSTINDSPITYLIKGQKPYSPQNYSGKYLGIITLKNALASSLNIPSVKLLNSNGVENMRNLGVLMGITTWNDQSKFGLSLALGANEIKMIDLAQAYSIFAMLGEKITINPILKINNYLNEEIYIKETERTKIIESDYSYIINWALSDDMARASTFGLNSKLKIPNKTVAVKTGTTNNLRDNWCIGWTPSYLVAVWVGNNDNSPMSKVASGISGATPIWNKIMTALLEEKNNEEWSMPEGVIFQLDASRSSQPHLVL